MNVIKSLELRWKYGKCLECGNELVGDGEGEMDIDDDVFRRSCKCGWSIEIKEAE